MELIPELREIESFQKSLKLNSIDRVATSGQKPTELSFQRMKTK